MAQPGQNFLLLILATYVTLLSLLSQEVTARSHGLKYGHHNHHHYHNNNNHHRSHHYYSDNSRNRHRSPYSEDEDGDSEGAAETSTSSYVKRVRATTTTTTTSTPPPWRSSDEEEYDYDDLEDTGRHAYLMTKGDTDARSSSSNSRHHDVSEDQTLNQAFEKHMSSGSTNSHDVYAYQLPTDLWFIVRYSRGRDGQMEKYMNVVDSFTNYLEKLEGQDDVHTVSVNVKGVETVFRLTPKRRPDNR